MMRLLVVSVCAALSAGQLCARDQTDARTPREEARRLLAADFVALNRGDITLTDLGERTCALAETASLDVQEILLSGAVRIFARANETDGVNKARQRLAAIRQPFVGTEREGVLRLGRFGTLSFAHCPTGVVDVVLDWTGTKSVRIRLTRPYWIMRHPLTRREAAFYPPLDPTSNGKPLDASDASPYVCVNRATAEDVSRFFTDHFGDRLPKGYVVRLPTLAEWEHAFHAGATEGDFADLRHIHHNDDIGRRLYYDYDANEPQRKKPHNAWGIGDWCPQEKVLDVVDASKLVRSPTEPADIFQVRELPRPPTTTDSVFACTNAQAVTLIRMPSWARWNAAVRNQNADWCPIRLVIAPLAVKPDAR